MNENQLKGNWKQLKGRVKEQWGKLTDDDLTRMNGQRDQLVGKLQEKYGIAKEEAQKQVKEFEAGKSLGRTSLTTAASVPCADRCIHQLHRALSGPGPAAPPLVHRIDPCHLAGG